MKTIFIRTFGIVFLLSLMYSANSQDPVFSSFYNNPIYYNPASPGIIRGTDFYLNYREQWPGIPQSNRSFNFSASTSFCGLFSLGFIASSNIEGESMLKTTYTGISIAVPVKISKHILLSGGISTSYGQKRIDWDKIEFDDEFDKLFGKVYPTGFDFPDENRKSYGDVGFGLEVQAFSNKHSHRPQVSGILGASFQHAAVFPNPNFIGTNINAIPFKQVYHLDLWFLYGNRHDKGFSPAIMYENQGQMQTFNASIRYLVSSIYFLGGFRNTNYKLALDNFDSFIFGFGYISESQRSRKVVKIGYSYDFTISKLMGGTYGTHEIFVVYSIKDCNDLFRNMRIFNRGFKDIDFTCPTF